MRNNFALAAMSIGWLMAVAAAASSAEEPGPSRLSISWDKNYLTIRGAHLPGEVRIHYLEAYCRAGSTDQDWVKHTVIKHQAEQVGTSTDRRIDLVDRLADGVVVTHRIEARGDEIDFRLVAHNPTQTASEARWAQPCVRVDKFTGKGKEDYIPSCFIFLDGRLTRLPTQPWATEARYTPGQVYAPRHVDRNDVNPRPLSTLVPSNGLCGCFSADGKQILATAWEPYQELFQGVATCIHSDFRIGGLKPGQRKAIRGKLYLVPADVPALVKRYERDFPEQVKEKIKAETQRVSGRITLNGTPIGGANIVFIPVAPNGFPAAAVTDDGGRFKLSTFEEGDGAVQGDYRVTVVAKGEDGKNRLPDQFGQPDTTSLTATVRAGPNVFEFKLQGR